MFCCLPSHILAYFPEIAVYYYRHSVWSAYISVMIKTYINIILKDIND